MTVRTRPALGRSFRLLCLALLASLGGCKPANGVVKGRVTLDDKPLTTGSVTFVVSKGTGVSGGIEADGTYTAVNVPLGEVTVVVSGAIMPTAPAGKPDPRKPPEPAGPTGTVPKKYQDPKTSGLTLTVQAGEQPFDIKLSSKEDKGKGK
jgi:hypothetical protein